MRRYLHIILILWICAACQENSNNITATTQPSITPAPQVVNFPTREARAVATRETLAATETASLPPTQTPQPTSENAVVLQATDIPTLDPALFTRAAVGMSEWTTIGTSVEGRAITARRFGDGERVLLLVGGMHGGWEANTVDLVEELIAHFEEHPEDVLPAMALVLIPAANPDGLTRGRTREGRFNGRGVDLNRNWACDWSPDAVWRNERVNAGMTAFSEPETLALAEYIRGLRPAAVLFYHSAANGVYAGDCDSDTNADSEALEAVIGEAAGYRYGQPFSAYSVTGTAPNWVDGIGIPSVDVELRTATDSEFEANLRGVTAAQRWVLDEE